MSDLLRRLVSRALGAEPVVQPLVGTRFGREPELLSERAADGEPPPAAATGLPGDAGDRQALPAPAEPGESDREGDS